MLIVRLALARNHYVVKAPDEAPRDSRFPYRPANDLPTRAGLYHLIPVMDGCSRKIMGRYFGPEKTSSSVQTAWDKSLAEEGLYAQEVDRLPVAFSDGGTQMTPWQVKELIDLFIHHYNNHRLHQVAS